MENRLEFLPFQEEEDLLSHFALIDTFTNLAFLTKVMKISYSKTQNVPKWLFVFCYAIQYDAHHIC